jgi:hypothetical protein
MHLADEPFFSVGATQYLGAHVIAAGRHWGDWTRLATEVGDGLACVARAEDTGEDLDDRELEAAAADFRYARDLVSQEEMEAWLARWSLSIEDWTEYLARLLLRRRWAAELEATVRAYPVDPDEIEAVIEAEAICAGTIAGLAGKLAGRAAAFERVRADGWRPATGAREDESGWLEAIDQSFDVFRERTLTPAALEDRIAAHRLDWVLVEGVAVTFPTVEAAREAALCGRDDGMAMEEVADAAGVPVETVRWYLQEIDPAQRGPFLGAAVGDVLGPLPVDDRFLVMQVRDKVLPSLANPGVWRRAEESVLRTALEHEVTRRVKWHRHV